MLGDYLKIIDVIDLNLNVYKNHLKDEIEMNTRNMRF